MYLEGKKIQYFLKRIVDILAASIGLVLACPLFLAIAIVIYLSMGNPILFTQYRTGRSDRVFKLYKFRTMSDERDDRGHLLPDAVRLKGIGKVLRKTSLDELPQLVNVLKGDMSLVGPRPLLVEYLPLYSPEQARRHTVLPGITGWVQVNGRNQLDWDKKFKLDVWYVDNWSLWLDFKILLLTVLKVLMREGISHQDSATMSKFEGNLPTSKDLNQDDAENRLV